MAGTPGMISTGPGWLMAAPVATTLPTTLAAAIDAGFRDVGYTEEGSTFSRSVSSEGIEVAEELSPVKYVRTGVEEVVAFSMAEHTKANLAMALNMGTAVANDGTVLNPPDESAELRIALLLLAATGARWVFKQCFNAGDLEIGKRRAPDKALIPVEFKLEVPSAGGVPWYVIPTAAGKI